MDTGIPGVDHVFVVALAARPDRLARVSAEMRAQGIRYEVFEAFDGRALRLETDATSRLLVSPENPLGRIPPGRLGCFLSKVALFRECARRGLGNVLILEDDVALDPDFAAELGCAIAELPAGAWDMLYCGAWDWQPQAAAPFSDRLYRPGRAMLLHAVLYAGHIFDALVEETRHLRETMDVQLSGRLCPGRAVFATVEPIARQRVPGDTHGG